VRSSVPSFEAVLIWRGGGVLRFPVSRAVLAFLVFAAGIVAVAGLASAKTDDVCGQWGYEQVDETMCAASGGFKVALWSGAFFGLNGAVLGWGFYRSRMAPRELGLGWVPTRSSAPYPSTAPVPITREWSAPPLAPAPLLVGPPRDPQLVGWRADPLGRYAFRFWDGRNWTARIAQGSGREAIDPQGVG